VLFSDPIDSEFVSAVEWWINSIHPHDEPYSVCIYKPYSREASRSLMVPYDVVAQYRKYGALGEAAACAAAY
jgi:hypothetical protein